ncbi:MAG: hypothetical protein FWF94_00100 [Oscillospiraceae bacterium]|nr:hypothetical protein [Oscillospiraceae bacterium]
MKSIVSTITNFWGLSFLFNTNTSIDEISRNQRRLRALKYRFMLDEESK